MLSIRSRCGPFALALALSALAAFLPSQGFHGERIDVAAQRGLDRIDGELWASGPRYQARLAPDGVCFVPALGRKAEHTRELRFELVEVGRASGPAVAAQSVAPAAGDFEVRYERAGLSETYAVRADGLEQSFVFAELPAGSGDLLVRGRVRTDLPLRREADGSLQFVDPALGGVVVRDVIGIDAGGRRVHGAMRCLPDAAAGSFLLELSLPAAFVDAATLPLVLDPFYGTVLTPGAGPDDEYSDVAYEPTNDVYLFVWDRSFSMFQIDLVGQRFSGAGMPVGGLITLKQGVEGLSRNRVVAVDARDAFVVAWYEVPPQEGIWLASVQAATGAVQGPVSVGVGFDPDLSVATDQENAAIVVWQDTVRGGISGARVAIGPAGGLSSGPVRHLSPTGVFPIAPRSGGAAGRMLVAWCQPGAIHGVVVDRNVQPLAGGLLFANPAIPNTVQLDGDDSQWIVAWSGGVTISSDLHCRRIAFDPAAATLAIGPQVVVANQPNVAEHDACVAWLGGVAAIGYIATANLGTPAETDTPTVTTIDGYACTRCAPAAATTLRPVQWYVLNARLCARPAQAGAPGEAMFTYMEGTGGSATIVGWRFRSDDGLEWDRGGACGGGGVAAHGCAVPGNAGYSLRLDAAPPLSPAFVVLGTQRLDLACGACTLVPDPASGASLFVGLTSAAGAASHALPVPASAGLTGIRFLEQWLTWSAGGCLGFTASNALEIQLQ